MSQIVIFKASLLFYTHSNTHASAFDVDREEIVSSSQMYPGEIRFLECREPVSASFCSRIELRGEGGSNQKFKIHTLFENLFSSSVINDRELFESMFLNVN
jgi:hypothetical protein